MSQKLFWKNLAKLRNNCSKLGQTVVKIRPLYEQISKISSHGWRTWKNWFFTFMTFLAPDIFSNHEILKRTKKWLEQKKLKRSKISCFMPVNHAKEFLKSICTEALFFNCFLKTLSSNFRVLSSFFKTIFGSNHYKWLVL